MKRRTVRVIWTGARAPTRAELRAIARGVKAGRIRSGDHVGPARAAVRKNPSAAEDAYREFHWGRPHKRIRRVNLPSYKRGLYELGKLVAVEYETQKGRERAIWVHHFDSPRPTLTATPSGKLGPIVGGRAYVTERGIEH